MASNYRSDIVSLAIANITADSTAEHAGRKYIEYYNEITGTDFSPDTTPWSGIFATYIIRKACVPEEMCPNFASPNVIRRYFMAKRGRWHEPGIFVPAPGDLIFFSGDYGRTISHIGIVVKVANGAVYVVEGNSSSSSDIPGHVRQRSYPLNSPFIAGYGVVIEVATYAYTPNHTITGPLEQQPELPAVQDPPQPVPVVQTAQAKSSTAIISSAPRPKRYASYTKMFQTYLKKQGIAGIRADGFCGPKTKKGTIKMLQYHLNHTYGTSLKVDGQFGPETIAAVREHAELHPGAIGPLVYLVQGLLYGAGYSAGGFDGAYGDMMKTAVITYQTKKGLKQDCVIGVNTWASLVR